MASDGEEKDLLWFQRTAGLAEQDIIDASKEELNAEMSRLDMSLGERKKMLRLCMGLQSGNFQEDLVLKVCVIGPVAVGKTCLIDRYVKGTFKTNSQATIGVDHQQKVVNVGRTKVRCQLWDIAGQERFGAMVRTYYNGADGCMIVLDGENMRSSLETQTKALTAANQYKADMLAKLGLEDDGTFPFMLCINKADKTTSELPDAQTPTTKIPGWDPDYNFPFKDDSVFGVYGSGFYSNTGLILGKSADYTYPNGRKSWAKVFNFEGCFATSAKTGDGIAPAMEGLLEKMLANYKKAEQARQRASYSTVPVTQPAQNDGCC